MKLAYADPPYLGCCSYYGHYHGADGRCWNDLETHAALVERLVDEYTDGWALSLTSGSLAQMLAFCPDDVRVAAWVKPWCSFKAANPAYAWEPVIFRGGRYLNPRGKNRDTDHHIRDWHSANVTTGQPVRGAKPESFCRWVLDLLGYQDGDELTDLFPGSGVMERVLAQGRLAV